MDYGYSVWLFTPLMQSVWLFVPLMQRTFFFCCMLHIGNIAPLSIATGFNAIISTS